MKNDVIPRQEDSGQTVPKFFSNIVSVVVSGYASTEMTNLSEPVSLRQLMINISSKPGTVLFDGFKVH